MRRELMIIVAVGVVAVAVAGFVLINGAGGSRSSQMAGGPQSKAPVAEGVEKPGSSASEPPSPPMVIRPAGKNEPAALPTPASPADHSENAASPPPAPLRDPVERTERPFALQPRSGAMETTGAVTPDPISPGNETVMDPPAAPPAKAVVIEPSMAPTEPLEPASPEARVPAPLPRNDPSPNPDRSSGGIPTAVRPAPAGLKPDPAAPASPAPSPELASSTGTPEGTSSAAAAPIMHTIAPGDTYSSLALKYLGSVKHADRISKANPDKDPRRLAVGTKIRIPAAPQTGRDGAAPPADTQGRSPAAGAPPAPTAGRPMGAVIPAPPTAPPAIAKGREYRVQPGEGWFDLAQRFLGDGRRWPELYELNRERVARNPSQLRSGTVIELPPGVTAPASGSASTTRPG